MSPDPDRHVVAETRLGRIVRATVATAVATSSRPVDHHRETNWLRDVILGGQDGLVYILGIILGVDRRWRLERHPPCGRLCRRHHGVDLHGSGRVHVLGFPA